ncbi:MAG: signal recognition particle-docking protein FtsY [Alphaproteobacteria bacterium]|nr:signal recognition particle-docking protein FtsY [Alphaproteobacteria bacterium]
MSWLEKLKFGLKKTARILSGIKMDLSSLEAIEEALIQADVGVATTEKLIAVLKERHPKDEQETRQIIQTYLTDVLMPVAVSLPVNTDKKPFIVLMIGVNGAGKTTTIGKLGQQYKEKGYKIAFVAGDTFRAGATEQLQKWGEKIGCPVYTKPNGDAAGLIFDAITESQKNGDDILFVDTAGRLQNRSDLMAELNKIVRVIQKKDETAPHASLLVLDATVGQNALSQVQTFSEMTKVTGLVMTKLDGTAKGGVLIALTERFGLPIHAIGVGEQASDLNVFTAQEYVDALLGETV